jgi:hypothetical protein
MLRHAMWILASVFILVVTAPDRAAFGNGHAFAKGGEGGGGGNGGGGNGGNGGGNGGNGGGNGGGGGNGASGGNGGGAGSAGGGGSASSGGSASGGGGSAEANGGGGRSTNDRDSLSAFITSPVFGRVPSGVPSTIAAGPIFAPRAGLVCQRMTQTIDIDGQAVHASALLCRQPDGSWRIAPQDARGAPPAARRGMPASRGASIARIE